MPVCVGVHRFWTSSVLVVNSLTTMMSLFLLVLPLLITCKPPAEDFDYYDYEYEDEEGVEEEDDVIYVLPVTHNECPSAAYECVLQQNCTSFIEEKEKLAALTSGTEEYKTLFASLQSEICNKEEKGVCCVFLGERSQFVLSLIFRIFNLCIFRSALFRRAAPCCRDCHWNFRRKRCVLNSNSRRCTC